MKSIQIFLALLSLVNALPESIIAIYKFAKKCGGPAKIQCDSGYCNATNIEGQWGTCIGSTVSIANKGEHCGGPSNVGCADNLVCKVSQCRKGRRCLNPIGTCVPADSITEEQTDSNDTQPDESANIQNEAESTPQTVNEGETCGGFTEIQCADGFYCDLLNDKYSGSLGTCRPSELVLHEPETPTPLANEGETCGGSDPKIYCADGFYCDIKNDKFFASPGTCRPKSELNSAPIAKEGEICGGSDPKIQCAEAFYCRLFEYHNPASFGTCQRTH